MKIVGRGGAVPAESRAQIDSYALELTGQTQPDVLFIATPKARPETFDKSVRDTLAHYHSMGVQAEVLYETFDTPPTTTEIEHKIGKAAVINVSGGDTLRAIERFEQWGIADAIRKAADKGTVLTGISAGAISWFSRGHSDSLSYRVADGEPWDYIWVDGLGIQNGLICPHYNTATAGGEARKTNLARMIVQSESTITEPIYGIDNRAAIVVNGEDISSLTIDDSHRVHVISPETGNSYDTLPLVK